MISGVDLSSGVLWCLPAAVHRRCSVIVRARMCGRKGGLAEVAPHPVHRGKGGTAEQLKGEKDIPAAGPEMPGGHSEGGEERYFD